MALWNLSFFCRYVPFKYIQNTLSDKMQRQIDACSKTVCHEEQNFYYQFVSVVRSQKISRKKYQRKQLNLCFIFRFGRVLNFGPPFCFQSPNVM